MAPEVQDELEVTIPAPPSAPRKFFSKRLAGFNATVFAAWIERWSRNAAVNYPIVSQSAGVEFLRKSAVNVPCIVVGIGPSLDDELENLKKAKGKAIIIATDAALRPLLKASVQPDLVINFDARDEQRTMWETVSTEPFTLLANSVTSPLTIDAWKGSLMFFNMMQLDDEFCTNVLPSIYPHLGQLPNMGTVGNGAVFLAWQMGCKPIMLAGMDLCYREEMNPEARPDDGKSEGRYTWRYRCSDWTFSPGDGAGMPDRWERVENKILYDNDQRLLESQDETIKGKTYKTDRCLKFYRDALVRNIGKFDMPVINCSDGILNDTIPTKKLSDVLAGLEPLSDGATVVKHLNKILPDPRRA